MTTEQTGRQTIDTTDSIELLVSPAGGDPTPLPETRAADGTRSKLKAAPPPIPSRTSSQTIVPPRPRASTQTIPPPIPSRTSAQIPAVAGSSTKAPPLPAHVRAKGTVPPLRAASADPDGWVVDVAPASAPSTDALASQIDSLAPKQEDAPAAAAAVVVEPKVVEPQVAAAVVEPQVPVRTEGAAADELRDIMDEDPEGPDATHATPFAVVDEGPSKEWLAKIDSVLRPEANAPVAFSSQPALYTTKAAATMFTAEPPQNTQPIDLIDLEPVEPPKVNLPALPESALATAATLPPLPTATLPPLPTATLPPVQVAPKATLPPPAQVVSPAPSLAIAPQARVKPLNARRAPIATPGGYPVVDPDLDSSTDQDAGSFDIDVDVHTDLTSAHTTSFEMPVQHRFISQRSAIAIFAGAAVLTVAYLATRGGPQKKPARTAAAETAPAETTPAPTPVPVAQPVAAPAQQVAAPTQTEPAPAQPAPAQQIAAAVPAPAEQPAAPAPAGMIQIPVSSKPSGALVSFVDGGHAVVVGRTPLTITLDPSQAHDIALTLLDHETQLATIPAGGMTALAVDMGPEKAGAMKAAPQQVATAAPRQEIVAAKPAKHEAATREAPRHEPKAQHITQPAPRAETPAAPSGSGVLMISSKPPCEIVVDGKSTHLTTPQRSIPLAPGTHTIMLVNAGAKIHKSIEVAITAKKPTKVIQDFTRH